MDASHRGLAGRDRLPWLGAPSAVPRRTSRVGSLPTHPGARTGGAPGRVGPSCRPCPFAGKLTGPLAIRLSRPSTCRRTMAGHCGCAHHAVSWHAQGRSIAVSLSCLAQSGIPRRDRRCNRCLCAVPGRLYRRARLTRPRPTDKHERLGIFNGYVGLRHRIQLIARQFVSDETASEIARACITR